MKIYSVIEQWVRNDSADYQIICVTADIETAQKMMKETFNEELENENISLDDTANYIFTDYATKMAYRDKYSENEYNVTISENELI